MSVHHSDTNQSNEYASTKSCLLRLHIFLLLSLSLLRLISSSQRVLPAPHFACASATALRARTCRRFPLYAERSRVVKRESTRTRCQGKYVLAIATNLSREARMARSHGKMDLQVAPSFAVVWATGCVGWWNGSLLQLYW
jgi:hypothetical protein